MAYFNKILIANRGEIARRIIKTCKKLDIKTVAVYSDADQDAPFVQEADEAYPIGPSQAKKSYLDIEKILGAAKASNADGIHPGYGFLSENSNFARRCEEEGIVFIGPSWQLIDLMGSKVKARQAMIRAGVPVVPGWDGKLNSIEEATRIAEDLGYPLMLKASAGGGGIGMQLIRDSEELNKVFVLAKQKASSSFGDDTVFLERFIDNARHIEVQVFGDHHGNLIHLFERECSIQRRNQKVIEESPSPALDPELRQQICQTALTGIKDMGYANAGTMEFIYDQATGEFYFLEMNTRLQVEHPVTEAVTGLDLVELQIKVAAKHKLGLRQEDLKQTGYAIEVRLYAEDSKTFMPSPGKLSMLRIPGQGVRLDLAVQEGSVVSPFYDPMIGKIIVHGENREKSLTRMSEILTNTTVEGVNTNLSLLKDIVEDSDFRQGKYTTRFLDNRKLEEALLE